MIFSQNYKKLLADFLHFALFEELFTQEFETKALLKDYIKAVLLETAVHTKFEHEEMAFLDCWASSDVRWSG